MTSLADRTIAALRAEHESLAPTVRGLDDEQLAAPSGAAPWPVAQALSHLGSGAEITLASVRGALGDAPPPAEDFNQGVWARWNAMSPREQAEGFVHHDEVLVAAFDAVGTEHRESLQVELGFLPTALPFAGFAAMRLNEAVMHGWDVRVAFDDSAAIDEAAALILLEHFAGALGFLTGFIGKPEAIAEPVVLELAGSGYALAIDDGVRITSGVDGATATFAGPVEAAVRMITGRLSAAHPPAGVQISGSVTLDQLRAVFPGY